VKSKRVTNSGGSVVSTVELDPWGGDTNRSSNEAFQPRRFTTYDRDGNSSDDAMHRRYNRWHSRFDQPDPYGGSYDLTDPQSFNRYSYVQNDPVNFVDPSGLCPEGTVAQPDARGEMQCVGVGVNGVTVNISGGERSSGAGGASSGPIEIETSGNEPTGAEIDPKLPADLCASDLLIEFNLRDAGGETNINLIHKSVADDFLKALLEINQAVPGGISFKDVFRDSAMQARRRAAFEAGRGAGARRPGTSSHEAGMAIDVAMVDVRKHPVIVGIFAKYGWIRPFNHEPWHFEPTPVFNKGLIPAAQEFFRNCTPTKI
jgi:RHS repeat-associated protein